MSTRDELLHLYLRDHLAGATAGRALARRLSKNHPDTSQLGAFAGDIEQDYRTLIAIMSDVGGRPNKIKQVMALVGERVGRLKLNGYLIRRSPLSSVMELELMGMGVEGKASGWRALRTLAHDDDRLDSGQLDELIRRAHGQTVLLDELRIRAVEATLGAASPGSAG